MPTAVNQLAGAPKLWPKSERKPLQPKNALTDAVNESRKTKTNPKQEPNEISPVEESNKENRLINSTPTKPKLERIEISPVEESNKENRLINSTPTKPKLERIEISPVVESNKENLPINSAPIKPEQERIEIHISLVDSPIYATPANTEPRDPSLAEELSAVRKKLDRLRLDQESTERMLKERSVMLENQMKEMERRKEIQKELEIEVDRLYRLKELQSFCMKAAPIKSLREKEQEKWMIRGQNPVQERKSADLEESTGENIWPSPCSDYDDTIIEETEESDL